MVDNIDKKIDSLNLSDRYHVWSGQCLTVAKAISDELGGDIILLSEIPGEGFDHACVEIDGKLYDGSGRVGWAETANRFISKESICEDPEENFYRLDNPIETFSSAFDEDTYQSIRSVISQ